MLETGSSKSELFGFVGQVFTDQMLFQSFNQQCQSTEGNCASDWFKYQLGLSYIVIFLIHVSFLCLVSVGQLCAFLHATAILRHIYFLLWPPCVADADIIFLSCFFFFFFFSRLISAVADWMSTVLLRMVWPSCEFRMQV